MPKVRLLSSAGITRFHRYYEPLRSPKQPSLALTRCRLVLNFQYHCWGFPCSVCFPMHACRRQYPGRYDESCSLLLFHHQRPSPNNWRVSTCVTRFEACSTFTRVTTYMLTEPLKRPFTSKAPTTSLPPSPLRLLPGGTNQFPGGTYPTGKHRLSRRTIVIEPEPRKMDSSANREDQPQCDVRRTGPPD